MKRTFHIFCNIWNLTRGRNASICMIGTVVRTKRKREWIGSTEVLNNDLEFTGAELNQVHAYAHGTDSVLLRSHLNCAELIFLSTAKWEVSSLWGKWNYHSRVKCSGGLQLNSKLRGRHAKPLEVMIEATASAASPNFQSPVVSGHATVATWPGSDSFKSSTSASDHAQIRPHVNICIRPCSNTSSRQHLHQATLKHALTSTSAEVARWPHSSIPSHQHLYKCTGWKPKSLDRFLFPFMDGLNAQTEQSWRDQKECTVGLNTLIAWD